MLRKLTILAAATTDTLYQYYIYWKKVAKKLLQNYFKYIIIIKRVQYSNR